MAELTVGSCFSGIGGLDLGLQRAGMEIRWQIENDKFCNEVLEKHWPEVKRYSDIREVDEKELEKVDIICGGWPCQNLSVAGRGTGLEGEKSVLFFDLIRIVRALRPRYILLENVAALANRGLSTVLGEMAEAGYYAEWDCLKASDVGAPHKRERIFIFGYLADTEGGGSQADSGIDNSAAEVEVGGFDAVGCSEDVENPNTKGLEGSNIEKVANKGKWGQNGNASRSSGSIIGMFREPKRDEFWDDCEYVAERPVKPGVRLLAYGIPRRVARLRALGNAVVSQLAQQIGEWIVEFDKNNIRK